MMKIGEHEVKVTSRDTATIGCQKVTRQQVVEVLRQIDTWEDTSIVSSDGSLVIHLIMRDLHFALDQLEQGKFIIGWKYVKESIESLRRIRDRIEKGEFDC